MRTKSIPESLHKEPRSASCRPKLLSPTISIPESLYKALPTILWRTDKNFQVLTGVTRKRMANLDAKGEGPAEKVCLGKNRVGYERDVLAAWLAGRMRVETRKTREA